MWKKLLLLAALGTIAAVLPGSPASAQATRTWVSGVGDDANPCSRTAPCKTFAGAIAKTSPGGEISVLDPGGFGAVTITKSITLDGGGGQVASVLVAGSNGIVVAAGATDVVILRNLRVNGLLGNGSGGSTGINGINYISGGEVTVDHCDIFGFNANGINVSMSTSGFLAVRDTTLRNNAGSGINATTTSGEVVIQADNINVVGTQNGGTPAQIGATAGNSAAIYASNSTFSNLSVGLQATGTGLLDVDNSAIYHTLTGISGTGSTTVNVSNNSLYNNGTAFSVSGTATSANNNRIVGSGVGTFSPSAMTQK